MKHCFIMFIAICSLLIVHCTLFSKGIIIGKDEVVLSIFKDKNEEELLKIANNIILKYDKVIIHLGRKYPFSKSFFSDEITRNNLKLFCDTLAKNDIKVYFWILDSYGSKNFKVIYKEYQNIVDDVISGLKVYKIQYFGLVFDLEWINNPNAHNNRKLVKLLKYSKEQLKFRELMIFAPIFDDARVNFKRGYDEKRILANIDNIIPMLYISSSNFCINYKKVEPCLNESRISSLLKYYKTKRYNPAVSLSQGFVIYRNRTKLDYIEHINNSSLIINNCLLLSENKTDFYSIDEYRVNSSFDLIDNEGKSFELKSKDVFYFFKVNNNIINSNDFIWEYSYVENL